MGHGSWGVLVEGPFGITESFTMPRKREMAAEITQLPCDLWELPTSEQETSGHLSKWEGQLAHLKDQWHPTGGDIPVKHLHLPAKSGPLWSTNGTKWAFPKPSPNIFTRILFLQDGFSLSIKFLFPSFLSFCAGSPPHKCIPVIKKKDAHHSSLCQGTGRSYPAQNTCQSFLFQSNKVVWFPGIYLWVKKGVKRVLALLPSPWAAVAHGSASPPPGLLAVLWLLPLWTGVTFSPDCGQKKK